MTWTQMFAEQVAQGKSPGGIKMFAHGEWDDSGSPYSQMVLTPAARAEVREWLRNFYPPASTTDD